MGPLQNFWWLETSKIMESQDSKQKYGVRSLVWTLLNDNKKKDAVKEFWFSSNIQPVVVGENKPVVSHLKQTTTHCKRLSEPVPSDKQLFVQHQV